MNSLKGQFLLATNQMPDPRFQEQVIYICAHDDQGVMGVVVNNPSSHHMNEVFKSSGIPYPKGTFPPIYIGGPVDMESAFFLYSSDYHAKNCMNITDDVSLSSEPQILHDIVKKRGPKDYLFVLGYAGWAAGQLENELSLNGWLTVPADYDILFNTDDSLKWKLAAEKYGINISLYNDEIGLA